MGFEDIRDQDSAVSILRKAIRKNRVSHAYLFSGPEGVGKELTAMTFAKVLNCSGYTDDCCDQCSSCRKIEEGVHLDVLVLRPTKSSRRIHVDNMRGLLQDAHFKPHEAKKKVYVLSEADRMTDEAANCFLKVLEEPPTDSVFLLLTAHIEGLLPTIVSRCQVLNFRRLSAATVKQLLQLKYELGDAEAASMALLSEGQMGRTDHLIRFQIRDKVLNLLNALQQEGDPVRIADEFLGYLKADKRDLGTHGEDIKAEFLLKEQRKDLNAQEEARLESDYRRLVAHYLSMMILWYRDALVLSETDSADLVLNKDRLEGLRSCGSLNTPERLAANIEALERTRYHLESNVQEARTFLNLFLELQGEPVALQ